MNFFTFIFHVISLQFKQPLFFFLGFTFPIKNKKIFLSRDFYCNFVHSATIKPVPAPYLLIQKLS